jgi:DNA-binding IclR family transcriptional regulator
MGLAYLAEMDGGSRETLVQALEKADSDSREKFEANLASAIQDYRELGFVSAFGTWHSYINAVGVAFRPTDGSPLVAVTCGGIVDILPQHVCRKSVGPKLVELVRRLRDGLAGTAAVQMVRDS